VIRRNEVEFEWEYEKSKIKINDAILLYENKQNKTKKPLKFGNT
jgi:hypothetical protein